MEDIYRGESIQLATTSMQQHHHQGKLDIYSLRIQFMQTYIKKIDLPICLIYLMPVSTQQTHQIK